MGVHSINIHLFQITHAFVVCILIHQRVCRLVLTCWWEKYFTFSLKAEMYGLSKMKVCHHLKTDNPWEKKVRNCLNNLSDIWEVL